jgi:hypothetical protein
MALLEAREWIADMRETIDVIRSTRTELDALQILVPGLNTGNAPGE